MALFYIFADSSGVRLKETAGLFSASALTVLRSASRESLAVQRGGGRRWFRAADGADLWGLGTLPV